MCPQERSPAPALCAERPRDASVTALPRLTVMSAGSLASISRFARLHTSRMSRGQVLRFRRLEELSPFSAGSLMTILQEARLLMSQELDHWAGRHVLFNPGIFSELFVILFQAGAAQLCVYTKQALKNFPTLLRSRTIIHQFPASIPQDLQL